MTAEPEELLRAWFGDDLDSPAAVGARCARWFIPDAAADGALRERFADLPSLGLTDALQHWRDSARSTLALVLALDQLPRNLHRGSAEAFAFDAEALRIALEAIEQQLDQKLHPVEAVFLYMPLEHVEDLALQERNVELFRALAQRAPEALRPLFDGFIGYAERHHHVIEQFDRFPHRNASLGRASSSGEEAFLASGGDTFDGASDGA